VGTRSCGTACLIGGSGVFADRADGCGVVEGVGGEFEADGGVAVGEVDDELVEVSVADDDEVCAAAVEVAALAGEGEEGWVDEELFVAIRLGCRG
jgi:hypothetical protein